MTTLRFARVDFSLAAERVFEMARRPKPWFRKSRKCWFVTLQGVQHNLGLDKRQAYEQFHELMRKPPRRHSTSSSYASVADAFLDWTLRNRAPATFEWYRERLQPFVEQHPELCVTELKPFHVEEWATRSGRSINTFRNKMRAVKRSLRWARAQGYIESNPLETMVIPSADPREVYVSPKEFAEILLSVPSKEFSDLIRATYEVGCRPQESLRLEARHVDLTNSRWVFPKSESKGKKAPRVVYLTEQALEITERLARRYPTGKIFRTETGRPWTTSAVCCQFTRLQIRLGKQRMAEAEVVVEEKDIESFAKALSPTKRSNGELIAKTKAELREESKRKLTSKLAREHAPRYSLYALRHSWATNALQKKGMDALTVAILMGHRDPSTLAKTYQHLSHNPAHLLEQARRAAR